MTIIPNYGKRETNLGCGWRLFHMVNKLKTDFYHESLTTVMDGPFMAAESLFHFHQRL
jgi:hypothetical protein